MVLIHFFSFDYFDNRYLKLLFISDQITSFIYFEIIDFIINNDLNNNAVLEIIICRINIF